MTTDPSPIVIPLRSKRRQRAQLVQKVQHLLPAALLLISAAAAFGEGAHGAALAIVKRDGGGRRIDLNDVENPAPVRRALEDARRRITQA